MPRAQLHRPFIKLLLLLRVIRWYNVLALLLAQLLVAWVVFAEGHWRSLLLDAKLLLIVVSSAFTVAAAFLINAFYDKDKDLVNNPNQVIMGRLMRQGPLMNAYVLFVALAIFIAFWASVKIGLFFLAYNVLCWFYSHKLQKLPWLREFSATLLTMSPLLAVWLHFGQWHWGFAYYLLGLMLLLLTRELWKDLRGHRGNIVFGYRTAAVQAGPSRLRTLLPLIQTAIVCALLGWSQFKGFDFDFYYSATYAMALYCLLLSAFMAFAGLERLRSKLDLGFKIGVVAYTVSLMLHGGGWL
jgi:4-hydroxybenzoate polyprenyltransferase